ncbi:MAG: phosphotransferase [Bacteroidales bacterium]|nr:phosphotransferase [Bacteroidales bacterium]MBS3776726.1 phosphotransferase [Bacteroidales bacterium]
MKTKTETSLCGLFSSWCSERPENIQPLPPTASKRTYYRIKSRNYRAIGVHNPNLKENKAFISMTRFFMDEKVPVPEIYLCDLENNIYILEDLGDQTLFSLILQTGSHKEHSTELKQWLKQALKELARIQVMGGKKMDFSICYPYKKFSRDSILWDLNYFREQFLNQLGIRYHSKKLERDFQQFADFIMQADHDYFMYRDFQSRNMMLHQNTLYFIDYQGGRKGPLQYDVASFLFQARAALPEELREEMLEYYMEMAEMLTPINRSEFLQYYYPVALVRVLQTLGAYGLRGLKEGKQHFVKSIPLALQNLRLLKEKNTLTSDLPELDRIIKELSLIKNIH